MFKKQYLIFACCLICSTSVFSQEASITEIQKLFAKLSTDQQELSFEYIEEKETIYISIKEGSIQRKGLKMLIKDIHPEGVFTILEEDNLLIRILSINNGHTFIKEVFRNGFRLSNTTNILDINNLELSPNLDLFVNTFKEFLRNRANTDKKRDEDINIVLPRIKN